MSEPPKPAASPDVAPGLLTPAPLAALRTSRVWAPAPPASTLRWALAAFATALVCIAAAWWTSSAVRDAFAVREIASAWFDLAVPALSLLACLLLLPAARSWRATQAAAATVGQDVSAARALCAEAKLHAWLTFGYATALLLLLAFALFIVANEVAVGSTFFYLPLIAETFWLVAGAFWLNVKIFCAAQVLVLVWGLVIALARLAPGAPGRPLRFLAIVYVDLFRGLPVIICIYMVGLGLPLTELPVFNYISSTWLAIFALTLTYGAYVSEVYRSGIESVHWSQMAAARSLGLSYPQTMRHVIVPQAIRRVIPPLLNDFISLQKDTALVNVIGSIDAFNQAKMISSNHFNLSAVTTVAFLFVLITIPQARMVDRLVEADQRRMRGG